MKRWTPEQLDAFVTRWERGWTLQRIGDTVGLSKARVAQLIMGGLRLQAQRAGVVRGSDAWRQLVAASDARHYAAQKQARATSP